MNKRLIIIFSSLVATVVLVVILCVIFITGDVTVKCATDITLDDAQKQDITLKSGIAKYTSIFAVSEDKAIANIEQNFPTLKVISIEKRFPNNIEIKVTGRIGIMAIAVNNGDFAILDRELKILKILPKVESGVVNLSPYTIVDGIVLSSPVVEGSFLSDNLWLKDLAMSAKDLSFLDARFYTFIKNISLNTSVEKNNVEVKTNLGVKFILDSGSAKKMFNLAYSYFLNLRNTEPQKLTYGHIIMQQAADGNENIWTWQESF